MIKMLQNFDCIRNTIKIFTLDNAQPFKDAKFIMFPVRGTCEIKKNDITLEKKHLVVNNLEELRSILDL